MRTGIGYDIHRLIATVEHSDIPIGGIKIPCYYRVEAHSDGDVLLHSLVDACLGALALGDIGQWFPDKKEENFKRPSADFLRIVLAKIQKLDWKINQVDSIIHLEEPRIAEHSDAIRRNLAQLFGTDLTAISIKAKSAEGLGPVGERRAIAAHAVVTLQEMKR